MTALDAVAAYLPDHRIPIEDLAGQLNLTPSQVQVLHRFHGLSEVCRGGPGTTPFDLLAAAVAALAELRGREQLVRYVLYARGVPVTTPYPLNPLHDLCRRLGLRHATAFTVTHHACATNLLAIDLAGRLLCTGGDPDALALIVAGETVFTQDLRLPPEARVFGEGSGACLVSAGGGRNRVRSYASDQRGYLDQWLPGNTGFAERFAAEYRELLAEVIRAAVDRAGLRLDDIALILPHNVNVMSWQRVSRMLGYPFGRVMSHNVPRVGHTFAADAFINYRTAMDKGLLRPGDHYLVAAAGYGATFSAMVFEH
ncbi:MAG TPA: 3-oxoacyl-[acyl-carrier-protein] synthase III C-terminal domain-containing protein [Actinophytocola sp.]|uniref:3-oxoacyl-[acyl-carrier-protein] synthase III C-terminal domain-containing protein n=1 Tax=Actinophytocola sp. TaxID=1872138 RepID=UPI002DBAE85D|nr:3-oxoacyl-[acyl-carrier-protein] synthase III C-terminal domain-containing protein [Actinophytocola sp.]HEU5469120.1 3-oxoacyl-[acyl-carrier-protein] synthase III C-terminal domain-containing protein [Actinophytocola sp.]